MWHFRWRNWTFDLVWAVSYLGNVASFFPLCGIFADYESFNPTYDPLLLPFWLLKKVGSLFVRLLLSERVSLLSAFGLMLTSIITQMADGKISLSAQLVWGFSHGICHIGSALSCLIFLQYMAGKSVFFRNKCYSYLYVCKILSLIRKYYLIQFCNRVARRRKHSYSFREQFNFRACIIAV